MVVESFNGRAFSLFASQDDVRSDCEPTSPDEPVEGWLRVKVLKREGDNVLVQLPQSTIENGSYLALRRDAVRAVPEVTTV